MQFLLIRWFFMMVSIIAAAYMIDGIRVSGFLSAFFAAAALGILNAVLRPVLFILTLPLNILTLGFLTFLINALMLKMAAGVIPGFDVVGFWPAVFGSLVISIVSWLLNTLISDGRKKKAKRHVDVIELNRKDGDRWE